MCRAAITFLSLLHLSYDMRVFGVLLICFTTTTSAGGIQSYINESGVKVFTNLGTSHRKIRLAPQQNRGSQYPALISDLAGRYSLDENLVKAIVSVESNYDPLAISPKGCKGLMQLHPDTAQRFGVRNIFDPAENIEGGIKYLRFLMNYFNHDLQLVLAAYNAGENAVTRYGGIPPYRETRDYVQKVRALYYSLKPVLEIWGQDYQVYRLVLPGGRILFTNTPRLTGLN